MYFLLLKAGERKKENLWLLLSIFVICMLTMKWIKTKFLDQEEFDSEVMCQWLRAGRYGERGNECCIEDEWIQTSFPPIGHISNWKERNNISFSLNKMKEKKMEHSQNLVNFFLICLRATISWNNISIPHSLFF